MYLDPLTDYSKRKCINIDSRFCRMLHLLQIHVNTLKFWKQLTEIAVLFRASLKCYFLYFHRIGMPYSRKEIRQRYSVQVVHNQNRPIYYWLAASATDLFRRQYWRTALMHHSCSRSYTAKLIFGWYYINTNNLQKRWITYK